MDLLSVFPYYFFNWEEYYWIRMIRLYKMNYTLTYIQGIFEKIISLLSNDINFIRGIARLIYFIFLLLLIGIIIASIWFYLGT